MMPNTREILTDAWIHAEAGGGLLDNIIRGLNEATPEHLEAVSHAFHEAARLVDQARAIRYQANDGEGGSHD